MDGSDSKTDLLGHGLSMEALGGKNYVLVIHGGAGTMSKENATAEKIAQYHIALREALLAGYKILAAGGQSMDAAVSAVSSMEGKTHPILA